MLNFPIPVLCRILNSPKRILHDHHLLFNFVKKIIQQRGKENENEIFQPLINSLDYLMMSNDELEELLENEDYVFINCNHSKERILSLISEVKNFDNKISDLEQKIKEEIENKQKLFDKRLSEMQEQINQQKEIILNNEKQKEIYQQNIKEQVILMNKMRNMLNKLAHLEGNISLKVEPNQEIQGIIKIKEIGTKLDKSKSKYILSPSDSSELGTEAYKLGFPIESLSQPVSFVNQEGTRYLHALIVDNLGNSKELISKGVSIQTKPLVFEFTGRVQSATLNPGNYKLEVWGAEGGVNGECHNYPGKGGYSVGILELTKRTTLYIYVGESPRRLSGGWNGGGDGDNKGGESAGGGGSTDISLLGEEGSTEWNTENHLYSRIIVAGGGGGATSSIMSCDHSGGGIGNRVFTNNKYSKGQGFGIGGSSLNGSSGGGGGWYGGGVSSKDSHLLGGFGGSSYIYSVLTESEYPNGCKLDNSLYLKNGQIYKGNASFSSINGLSIQIGHSGNGYAKITSI